VLDLDRSATGSAGIPTRAVAHRDVLRKHEWQLTLQKRLKRALADANSGKARGREHSQPRALRSWLRSARLPGLLQLFLPLGTARCAGEDQWQDTPAPEWRRGALPRAGYFRIS
jgi:hypothetical protein